jgi:hypothetical protein
MTFTNLFLFAMKVASSLPAQGIPNGQQQNMPQLPQNLPTELPEGTGMIDAISQFYDWKWFLGYLLAVGGIFAVILFGFLFIKKWNNPRLGFFLITGIVIITRLAKPENIFWKVMAGSSAIFAFVLFFTLFRDKKLLMLKEPTYYLFNGFALVMMTMPIGVYNVSMAVIALAMSLFFITTPKKHHAKKFTGTVADANILEKIEKTAHRPW